MTAHASSPPRPLSPVFWVLFWGMLVNRAASFVGTFLALHLIQDLRLSQGTAGWIVSCWGLGSLISSPVAGVLADRLGRRATMLLGLTLGGLSVLALAFVTDVPALYALALVGGGTTQLFFPAANAAIADVAAPEDRPRAFGLIYWAVNIGFGIGYAVGGLVPDRYIRWLFAADAVTTFVCAALVAWRVPETRPATAHHEPVLPGLARVATDGPFLAFMGLHLAALVVFTQFQLALPLDMKAHDHGSRQFAWLMAFNCAGVVALQPLLAPRLRGLDRSRLLATSALFIAVGYGVYAFVPALRPLLGAAGGAELSLYLFGAALWTVGEVVGFPAASSLVADLSPAALRGRYQGAFSMVWASAMTLSPTLGGQALEHLGAPALWGLCLAAGVAVAAGHLAASPSRRRRLAAIAAAEGVPPAPQGSPAQATGSP